MRAKAPRSLRTLEQSLTPRLKPELAASGTLTAAALIAAGTATTAEAQQSNSSLPAVTVDAPRVRQRQTLAPRPTPAATRARTALRRAVRQPATARAVPTPGAAPAVPTQLPILAQNVDANPYAQPGVPYKVNRVQSTKITEPILNTPRTITVLPKEVLDDKGATSLRELGRSTAGVTLGTGEGGNAFGDRFFIRGFDARNDIFVDGIRDPGLSIRENFFTEQVEILRGPGSTFAGRGVTGGAINIVTKQAFLDRDFRIIEAIGGVTGDQTKRITVDINQAISPILAVRVNGLYQGANVAGRSYVIDDRWGLHAAFTFKPVEQFTLTGSYTHTDLRGLPDFGVPFNRIANRPFTEGAIPRYTYYGFVHRDFQKARQDIGTVTGEYKFSEDIVLTNKFRREQALLSYVGTLPEAPNLFRFTATANPQSRYQTVAVTANQTDLKVKFDLGPVRNTSIFGVEFSREQIMRDSYSGLASEALPGGFNGTGSIPINILFPPNELQFRSPTLLGNPTIIPIDTKAGYFIHTANWNDFIILNGGVRVDRYNITAYSATTNANNASTMVNYNVGGVIKPLPWISLYSAFATSSNPVGAEVDGTTAQYGGLNQADQIFAPEKNRAVEVGSKFELFDRRLLLTGAAFQTEKDNAREITGAGATAVVSANAAYRIRGLDFEVAGKITDRWSVIGGLVLMQTKVTKSAYPSNVGLPLANIAHASFSMLTKYQILDYLELGGQAVYNSRRYGGTYLAANGATAYNAAGLPAPTPANPFVNVPTQLPSYWRFDSFAEMKFGTNLKAKLAVYNIFNRTYYDSFYQSAAPFAIVAPGRTIQFTATATF